MTQTPEWTYRHADRMRDHWWWRPGWGIGTRFYTWHLTFDGQPGLHGLVDAYQQRLTDIAELDLVPRKWLHLTMQGVGFITDVSDEQLADIVAAVRGRLNQHPPFKVTFHEPVIRPEAIALAPDPLAPVDGMRAAIRAAMADVIGEYAVPEPDAFQPHVSLAYSNADHQSAEVARRLDEATVVPASVTIDRAALIELHRDNRMYEWRTITTVPLAVPR